MKYLYYIAMAMIWTSNLPQRITMGKDYHALTYEAMRWYKYNYFI